jgi:hypothetical protein
MGTLEDEDFIGGEGWPSEDLDIDAWKKVWNNATPIPGWSKKKAKWFRSCVFAAGGWVDTGSLPSFT